MDRILLTGANGFLGSSLARRYNVDPNTELICMVRDSDHNIEGDHIIVKGNVTNFNFVRRVIADYEITHVFHLAAQAIVRVCAQDPVSAYESNVMGTVKLLEAIRQVGMSTIKSIIVSTSDKAFGHATPPYTEETPLQPMYSYEATKACQDIVAQNYFHNYGLPIKIARCSNIYGPKDPNYSRLIPNTISKVLRGERPQIYTSVMDYVREWIYIEDVMNAFQLILYKGVPGEAYCVGGTEKAAVKDVVQTILNICGSDQETEFIKKATAFKEIESQWMDATKLKTLGWVPKYSLKEGLTEMIECHNV